MTTAPEVLTQTELPQVWLLFGQKAGDNNQVRALAEAIGWPWTIKQIVNQPWELLTNLVLKVTLAGIDRKRSSPLTAPWPDLIISAGRRNEPVARWVRQQSGGRTRLVHIGRPWSPLDSWDLIVTTPQYFLPNAENILHNELPLHLITPARLEEQRQEECWQWSQLSRPYTVVMLGGNSGKFVFTRKKGQQMGSLVNELASDVGGSVLVTDSRRTPVAACEAFLSEIHVPFYHHAWSSDRENPYHAFLAMADYLVVTGESMSMLAEAAATGKPLYIFDLSDRKLPWWSYFHNYSWKSLSHHLAMALGPRRMRRDIARIQSRLVDASRAQWLENWQDRQEPRAQSSKVELEIAQGEAQYAAVRVRELFDSPRRAVY